MKTARVIITTECNFNCGYCCNKLPSIKRSFKMTTMDEFLEMNYSVVNITGGEPMLCPGKLRKLINGIRCADIYLYTNGYGKHCDKKWIAKRVQGINVGAHHDMDYALSSAVHWRQFNDNVILHIEDDRVTSELIEKCNLNKIKVKTWTRNNCNKAKEDRWII